MQKAKVSVLVALFAYSGNGGIPGTIPAIAFWLARVYHQMKTDARIDKVWFLPLCDTPITMTRNLAVDAAQKCGADMLLMLDSDNEPDGYVGVDPEAKPFWETAFELAYNRLLQGKPTVAMAPYSGPPQHPTKPTLGEVPYAFEWINDATDDVPARPRLVMLTRNEAAKMRGVQPAAAGPTGVSLFTINAFEPVPKPYFDYDMNKDGTAKESTEDVYCTRNISLIWTMTRGENPVFLLWDCWALHHKIKLVGRPTRMPVEAVSAQMAEAIRENWSVLESFQELDCERQTEPVSPAEAERIVQMAKEAMHAPEPSDEVSAAAPGDDEDSDEDLDVGDDDSELLEHRQNGNGKPHTERPVVPHVIGRRKVFSVGGPMPMADVVALGQIARKAIKDRALLVHPWSGEGAAALLGSMPAKATLYIGDSAGNDSQAVECLARALAKDFEAGRLRAVAIDDFAQMSPQDLDLIVVLETPDGKISEELLDKLLYHVSPSGALAGINCSDEFPETQKTVLDFAGRFNVSPRVMAGSSVWILPKAQILAEEAARDATPTEAAANGAQVQAPG